MKYIKTLSSYIKEGLTEDQIMNDKNTSYEEKEEMKIKMNLDHMNEYRSKKSSLENMFFNLDNEVDNTTVNKMVEDNRFLKDYTQLLYRKRDKMILTKQLEDKEEEVRSIRSEIANNTDLSEVEVDTRKENISNLEEEISNIEESLKQYDDVDSYIKKWDERLTKIKRELLQGKPLVIGNLLHFK